MFYVLLLGCLLMGYLLGSINTSVIVGKCMGVDIRTKGSGNAGATNTLRTLGKKAAVIVLLGDVLKSVLSVVLAAVFAKMLFPSDLNTLYYCQYLAGLGAILGHNFPVYFGFRGGKGVLSSIAVILILDFRIGLMLVVISILIMAVTRYVSLGSVIGAILYPLFVIALNMNNKEPYVPYYIALSIIIAGLAIYQHRANLQRLMSGTESKLDVGKKKDGK